VKPSHMLGSSSRARVCSSPGRMLAMSAAVVRAQEN
jgi:hypothetical protein